MLVATVKLQDTGRKLPEEPPAVLCREPLEPFNKELGENHTHKSHG